MRTVVLSLLTILAIVLCGAGYWFGRNIPFVQQWPLFEALRNTAAIIFAVVGAWLAIIYPERLKISFGKPGSDEARNPNIGLLLTPAVHSTIILVILLFIGILAPMLKQVAYVANHAEAFRGASFCMLTFLTVWQAAIVVMTVYPADLVKLNSDSERARQSISDQRNSLRKQIPPNH